MLVLLAGMLVIAVAALRDEWRVHEGDRALQPAGYADAPYPTAAWVADTESGPARAVLLRALGQARLATRTTDPEQQARNLAAAGRLADAAAARRPVWANARVVQAYVAMLREGPDAPATREAFARSYAAGGYLADAATWRVAYGLSRWQTLDPALRRHVVDEAAWFSQAGGAGYRTMTGLMAGRPAEVAFMQRRAELARSGRTQAD